MYFTSEYVVYTKHFYILDVVVLNSARTHEHTHSQTQTIICSLVLLTTFAHSIQCDTPSYIFIKSHSSRIHKLTDKNGMNEIQSESKIKIDCTHVQYSFNVLDCFFFRFLAATQQYDVYFAVHQAHSPRICVSRFCVYNLSLSLLFFLLIRPYFLCKFLRFYCCCCCSCCCSGLNFLSWTLVEMYMHEMSLCVSARARAHLYILN